MALFGSFMALIIAEVKPLCSNSLIPLMVIPPEWLLCRFLRWVGVVVLNQCGRSF